MKKKIILISIIFICTFVLCALAFNMLRETLFDTAKYVATSKPSWHNFKATKTPDDFGTEWESEDGKLIFSTTERYRDVSFSYAGHSGVVSEIVPTRGVLLIEEKVIDVLLSWDSQSPCVTIHLDNGDPLFGIESESIIEVWSALGYEETDEKIVFSMQVDKTTYYEAGQIVKLVYIKK